MSKKIRKPSDPTTRIPAPAIFAIWKNSDHEGVLANFNTLVYAEKLNGTSMGRVPISGLLFPSKAPVTGSAHPRMDPSLTEAGHRSGVAIRDLSMCANECTSEIDVLHVSLLVDD